LPDLVRASTGQLVQRDWVGPAPSSNYVVVDSLALTPLPEPWPDPPSLDEDSDWAPAPNPPITPTTAQVRTTQGNIIFNEALTADWGQEARRIQQAIPPFRAERDTPRASFKHFEQTLSKALSKKGFQKDKTDSVIGLELENEALKAVNWPDVRGWAFHNEGSLRGYGFEYVQQSPDRIKETFILLKSLLETIKARIGKVSNSIRTSTHVHFDCTQYTFLDIINFSCLYWMLESFLSHYCGESRKGNLFCLRLKDAAAGQILLQDSIRSGVPYGVPLIRNDYRYSSLNFSSLGKFGSLEFRMLRGTDDYETIVNWVNALEAVKQYALKFKTPKDLNYHFIKEIDAKDLPKEVLGEDLFKIFNECRPKEMPIESEIREGFLSVSGILSAHKTWDFTEEIKAEKEREKAEQEHWERVQVAEAEQRQERARIRAQQQTVIVDNTAGPDETPDQYLIVDRAVFRDYIDE